MSSGLGDRRKPPVSGHSSCGGHPVRALTGIGPFPRPPRTIRASRQQPGSATSGEEIRMTRYHARGRLVAAIALGFLALAFGGSAAADPGPDLGPNTIVFDPSMSTSDIQATVDA